MDRLGIIPFRAGACAPANRKRLQANKAYQVFFFFFKPTSDKNKKPNPLAMLTLQHHSKPKRTVPQNRNNRYHKKGIRCPIPWHTLWSITWHIKGTKFKTKPFQKENKGNVMAHTMPITCHILWSIKWEQDGPFHSHPMAHTLCQNKDQPFPQKVTTNPKAQT